jgi:hypothetical protein
MVFPESGVGTGRQIDLAPRYPIRLLRTDETLFKHDSSFLLLVESISSWQNSLACTRSSQKAGLCRRFQSGSDWQLQSIGHQALLSAPCPLKPVRSTLTAFCRRNDSALLIGDTSRCDRLRPSQAIRAGLIMWGILWGVKI